MTAQKTITSIGVFVSIAAALVSVWSYARSGDPYSLVTAVLFSLAGVFGVVQIRRRGPSDPSSLGSAGAGSLIAKFIGFAAACWLLLFVRVRGDLPSLLDPLNVLVLLMSVFSLVLGGYFALLSRETRRHERS
jgi:peptidoglycan biosynthesis protein MviN/MurJ (putative lipid II flippase)